MKLIKFGIIILSLVLFFGIYPRELQQGAPTVFALFTVVVFNIVRLLTNELIDESIENYETME